MTGKNAKKALYTVIVVLVAVVAIGAVLEWDWMASVTRSLMKIQDIALSSTIVVVAVLFVICIWYPTFRSGRRPSP